MQHKILTRSWAVTLALHKGFHGRRGELQAAVLGACRRRYRTCSATLNYTTVPLQSTDFTNVPKQFHDLVVSYPDVIVPYTAVATSTCDEMSVPGDTGNLRLVPIHFALTLASLNVP